ncbi:transmembrane protein, putative (macronuclear) [Tetrahymena thermophila SB210]|uniref:Transmembrane protein, putative n=1 Tax=Tetrahymena thermophila (strain SB210) TaxID=312017 RepID=W7X1D3_TETTS|nr:transmembrane protein, putative [Tetrahymena thermophila SB210]EWS73040.1 transmembrane protein, putative [Tetrahymena thermophila SB210]|eukprot:XP_012654437.1 transmembrane protein, putative [Tetrahymena thermophila SB210]
MHHKQFQFFGYHYHFQHNSLYILAVSSPELFFCSVFLFAFMSWLLNLIEKDFTHSKLQAFICESHTVNESNSAFSLLSQFLLPIFPCLILRQLKTLDKFHTLFISYEEISSYLSYFPNCAILYYSLLFFTRHSKKLLAQLDISYQALPSYDQRFILFYLEEKISTTLVQLNF